MSSFVQTPRAHEQKLYILSSFLYAGFMLYKFYMQLLASFLSLKLSLLLSMLLFDIINSTAILPACVCSCCGLLCETLLQDSWLLSMQLLAIWNSATIFLAIVYVAVGNMKLCYNTPGYCTIVYAAAGYVKLCWILLALVSAVVCIMKLCCTTHGYCPSSCW